MERQVSTSLVGISAGHKYRYEFAKSRVSGRVLDAACGCGYGSRILHDAGCVVTGVDLCKEAIDHARKYFPGPTYVNTDVYSVGGEFDWVVCLETLEHLPHAHSTLISFRRISKRLIVSTPNQERYPFNPKSYKGDEYPHLKHYTPQELDRILKMTGWTVSERYCQVNKQDNVTEGTDGKFMIYVC